MGNHGSDGFGAGATAAAGSSYRDAATEAAASAAPPTKKRRIAEVLTAGQADVAQLKQQLQKLLQAGDIAAGFANDLLKVEGAAAKYKLKQLVPLFGSELAAVPTGTVACGCPAATGASTRESTQQSLH